MCASAKENNEATKAVKRSKAIYILDSIKYDLKALDEQLALDLLFAVEDVFLVLYGYLYCFVFLPA